MQPAMANITHDLVQGTRLEIPLLSEQKGERKPALDLVKLRGFRYSSGKVWKLPGTEGRRLSELEVASLSDLAVLLRPLGVLVTVDITEHNVPVAVAAPEAPVAACVPLLEEILPTARPLTLSAVRRPWVSPGAHPNAWVGSRRADVAELDPHAITERIKVDIMEASGTGQLRLAQGARVAIGPDINVGGWRLVMLVRGWPTPYRFSQPVPIKGLGETILTADVREVLATLVAIADQYGFCNDNPDIGYYSRAFGLEVAMDEMACSKVVLDVAADHHVVPTDHELMLLS